MGQFNSVLMLKTRLLQQQQQSHKKAIRGADYVFYDDLNVAQQNIVRDHYKRMFEQFQENKSSASASAAASVTMPLHLFVYGDGYHMTSHQLELGTGICCTTVWTPIARLVEFIQDYPHVIEHNIFPKGKTLTHVYHDKYYKCTGILNIRARASTSASKTII